MKDNCKLLSSVLTAMLTKFNPAYFDRYSSDNIGLVGIGFNLVLLDRYGKTAQMATNCYSFRVFDLLFYHLGLVTMEEKGKYSPDHVKLIRSTPLFEALFSFM
jgi:hypothetical protein